mmetsp:Transcript_8773/g.30123  ORF Transcript_8773/g.30123 Transcript_8773/m.30123 type:complete len:213 (+) Transcript_8773:1-639(+)
MNFFFFFFKKTFFFCTHVSKSFFFFKNKQYSLAGLSPPCSFLIFRLPGNSSTGLPPLQKSRKPAPAGLAKKGPKRGLSRPPPLVHQRGQLLVDTDLGHLSLALMVHLFGELVHLLPRLRGLLLGGLFPQRFHHPRTTLLLPERNPPHVPRRGNEVALFLCGPARHALQQAHQGSPARHDDDALVFVPHSRSSCTPHPSSVVVVSVCVSSPFT